MEYVIAVASLVVSLLTILGGIAYLGRKLQSIDNLAKGQAAQDNRVQALEQTTPARIGSAVEKMSKSNREVHKELYGKIEEKGKDIASVREVLSGVKTQMRQQLDSWARVEERITSLLSSGAAFDADIDNIKDDISKNYTDIKELRDLVARLERRIGRNDDRNSSD